MLRPILPRSICFISFDYIFKTLYHYIIEFYVIQMLDLTYNFVLYEILIQKVLYKFVLHNNKPSYEFVLYD